MAGKDTGSRPPLTLEEAADFLAMSPDAVRALAGAGYLAPADEAAPELTFPFVDLKAFQARNAENGSGNLLDALEAPADPKELLEALDGKSEEMARRAFDIFATVFPESTGWSISEQSRFVEQAKARFEAILAVTSQGAEVDDALVGDLEEVGGAAAWGGSPLPQLLIVLRISRDLVVQTAVELAEERGRHWGMALSLLLTRVLPAMDRLTDSLAKGYWSAMIGREEESRARYEHVVEQSSDGIFEVDPEGHIQYANPSLAIILGRPLPELEGASLDDLLVPVDPAVSLSRLFTSPAPSDRLEVAVTRPDGVRRVLDITSMARYEEGGLVGFQGIVRDITAARALEADKNEFLAFVTFDLRNPLTTVLGLGATLETHADELPADRVRRMGGSIRRHAERISRLADDLYDLSRLESRSLMLAPRTVNLAQVVDDALASVDDATGVGVRIPPGVEVHVDPRRLEQVVANLVDNGLQHGAAPVVIELVGTSHNGMVELAVTDAGQGVPDALAPTLFSRLRALSRANRDRSRGTGLGLSLVQGLVEAMGGRVWYERAGSGGASFHLTLPTPRRG